MTRTRPSFARWLIVWPISSWSPLSDRPTTRVSDLGCRLCFHQQRQSRLQFSVSYNDQCLHLAGGNRAEPTPIVFVRSPRFKYKLILTNAQLNVARLSHRRNFDLGTRLDNKRKAYCTGHILGRLETAGCNEFDVHFTF